MRRAAVGVQCAVGRRRAVRSRRVVGLSVALLGVLAFAGTAAADKEKIQLTAAGQAAARAAVLQRSDIGTASGWSGGPKKPNLTSTPPCPSFQPKQSDLVLVGAAESVWHYTGIEFDSQAQVLQTPAMVSLDWQRTVATPKLLPCLRDGLTRALGASKRLVSLRPLAFPALATYTRAYRALVDVVSPKPVVHLFIDFVLVGRARTEITLTTTALIGYRPAVAAEEVKLARALVARVGP